MLNSDLNKIGEKIKAYRKKAGMTQLEVAVSAFLSERAYADIERGQSNARLDSVICICNALDITLNDIVETEEKPSINNDMDELLTRLSSRSAKEQQTAMALLSVYLDSLR